MLNGIINGLKMLKNGFKCNKGLMQMMNIYKKQENEFYSCELCEDILEIHW